MAILHLDSDQVDENGIYLLRASTDILNQVGSLKNSIGRLRDAWSGDVANDTIWGLEGVAGQLESLSNQLDNLSRRIIQESQQWLAVDGSKQGFFSAWASNLGYDITDLPKDLAAIGGAGYIIATLHGIAARASSIPIHGPGWLLEAVGFGPHQRIMSPGAIQKQLLGSSAAFKGGLIAGLYDGAKTGIDTYFHGQYAGTSRALPAAVIDWAVKGLATGLVSAGLIALTGAIIGTAASPIIAGAAVIGVCVVGGLIIDKAIVDPLFKIWQKSHLHAELVEDVTRVTNNVSNYVRYKVQSGADKVRNAFSQFYKTLMPAHA